jgi:hypothetical protein
MNKLVREALTRAPARRTLVQKVLGSIELAGGSLDHDLPDGLGAPAECPAVCAV